MNLIYPLKSVRITQEFGKNPQIYKQFGLAGHNGLDFGCTVGTPLYAPCDMVVKVLANQGSAGYGRYVRAWSADKAYELTFGHLSGVNPEVKVGSIIKQGTVFAQTGNTGFSTGPHLHFGVRKLTSTGDIADFNNGYKGAINPKPFFMPQETSEMQLALEALNKRQVIKDISNPGRTVTLGEIALIVERNNNNPR